MATASHDIRFKRSNLILLNSPYWKFDEGEPLTTWWARIDLPEEFRNRIDNNTDIVDFVFSERRIETTLAEDFPKARHMRGYLLHVTVNSDERDAQ